MEQRRHFFRVLFAAPGTLRWGGHATSCEIRDLSLKGALVATPGSVRLEDGAACTLELPLGGDGACIAMDGVVAHHHDGILGLHCRSIDLDSITHLRRLVELNRGDAADLQRELAALSAD